MKLSEMNYDDIELGKPVISDNGVLGNVVDKWLDEEDREDRQGITIAWNNGTFSDNWLFAMNKVTVVEEN